MNDEQTKTFIQAMEVIAGELVRINANLERMFNEIETTLTDRSSDS